MIFSALWPFKFGNDSVKSCFLSPVRLSPENQDLNERVRLSPAFFVNHFQDLTVTGVYTDLKLCSLRIQSKQVRDSWKFALVKSF